MSKFGEGLDQLKNTLLEMSSLVEAGIRRSIVAVVRRDRAAAEEVFNNESRINAIELKIDGLAIDLLALHQPMAKNLRLIIAALKINTNLERMGDLAVTIGHSGLALIESPPVSRMIDIPLIAEPVESMVRNSMDAFVASDAQLARSVLEADDAVDRLRTVCYHQLLAFMKERPENIRPALNFLDVTRTLERLADHATNIAEDVLFYVQGIDVRHHAGATRNFGKRRTQ